MTVGEVRSGGRKATAHGGGWPWEERRREEIPEEGEEAGPAETVIQSGDQQGRKKNQLGPSNDGFLLADLFLRAQAALNQLGIAVHEINRGNRHGEEQDGHEDPALPIAEGTGGDEEK